MKVQIVLEEGVALPKYETIGAAAMDVTFHKLLKIYNDKNEEFDIPKHFFEKDFVLLRKYERVLISTGIKVKIPEGYYISLLPRSGNALKRGISFTNSEGVIDSDYTGTIGIIIENNTNRMLKLFKGERLGQIMLKKKETIEWDIVNELEETKRGSGGFGHTGNK